MMCIQTTSYMNSVQNPKIVQYIYTIYFVSSGVQEINPIHSTPVPKDLLKLDLMDVFNNISTDISENCENSQMDISLTLNSVANINDPVIGMEQSPPVPKPRNLKPAGTTMLPPNDQKPNVVLEPNVVIIPLEPKSTTMTPLGTIASDSKI